MNAKLIKQYVNYLKDVKIINELRILMLIVYDFFKGYLKESIKKKI